MHMNKNGFIWYLFEREVLYFLVGLVIGVVLTVLVAQGVIPLPWALPLCPVPAQ